MLYWDREEETTVTQAYFAPLRHFLAFPKFEGHKSSGLHTNETLTFLTKL